MPLYYGHPTTQSKLKKTEVSPALKDRGIELLRAAPSQVQTLTVPFVDSTLWASFVSVLSAIVFSLSVGKVVPLNRAGYRVDAKHPNPLPIRFPDLCIQVTNPGPKVHEWLLDRDFEEQEIRGGQYYLLPCPPKDTLEELMASDCPVKYKDTNFVPFRYANMDALFVFSEITNLLSYALSVLSVALFVDAPDRRVLLREKKTDPDVMEDDSVSVPLGGQQAQPKMEEGALKHVISSLFPNLSALTQDPSSELKVDASPFASSPHWTTPSIVHGAKNLVSGIVARFVPDLCEDDPAGVPSFIFRYLRRSLGNSTPEILETFGRLKSAWGILKSTSAGHILSHIVKTMEIAIEAHCCLVTLFDEEFYEGSVLQGLGFVISLRTQNILPLGVEDLRKELELMSTHRGAVSALRKLLVKAKVKSDDIPADFEDMDKVRICIRKGSFDEEHRSQVVELVKKLRFPIRKWSINMRSINQLVTLLSGGVNSIDSKDPIGPEAIFSNDPLEIAMSCFVPGSCPSFRHPSGVPIDLTRSKAPSPPDETKKRKGRGPQQVNNGGWIFTVRRVDFTEAVADFRTLVKEREARSMSSAAARGLGYFVISGGNFETVFQGLKKCLGVTVQSEGKKSDMADEEGREVDLLFSLEQSLEGDRKRRRLML